MFKWIALTVATLGIAALAFCLWPRPRVEGQRIITSGGNVFTLGGQEVVLETQQAEMDRKTSEAAAADESSRRAEAMIADLQKRPPANVPARSDEIQPAPKPTPWKNAYSNAVWSSTPPESIARHKLEEKLAYSASPGDERQEDLQLMTTLRRWAARNGKGSICSDLSHIAEPPEIPRPLPDPEYKHAWSQIEGPWFEQMAIAISNEQRNHISESFQSVVDPDLDAFDVAILRRFYSTAKAVAAHNAGL